MILRVCFVDSTGLFIFTHTTEGIERIISVWRLKHGCKEGGARAARRTAQIAAFMQLSNVTVSTLHGRNCASHIFVFSVFIAFVPGM